MRVDIVVRDSCHGDALQCDEDIAESVETDTDLLEEIAETPLAMQDKDLRSMKDALLIETSQILGVCVTLNFSCPHLSVCVCD